MPDPLPSLLETTLAAARADEETVTSEGKPTSKLPDGMRTREVPRHLDDRGSVVELYDTRWNWHPDPINFVWVMPS
jgi:dTDP-4-dehydrorhamnose 3,5-epimerase